MMERTFDVTARVSIKKMTFFFQEVRMDIYFLEMHDNLFQMQINSSVYQWSAERVTVLKIDFELKISVRTSSSLHKKIMGQDRNMLTLIFDKSKIYVFDHSHKLHEMMNLLANRSMHECEFLDVFVDVYVKFLYVFMYVFLYVCICLCMYVCACTCTRGCKCTCFCKCICISFLNEYTCMFLFMCM